MIFTEGDENAVAEGNGEQQQGPQKGKKVSADMYISIFYFLYLFLQILQHDDMVHVIFKRIYFVI